MVFVYNLIIPCCTVYAKSYALEVSLIRGRLYHSTDKLIHNEKKTTLLSYPVGSRVPCKKSLNDIVS